jgi:hypothetical protein
MTELELRAKILESPRISFLDAHTRSKSQFFEEVFSHSFIEYSQEKAGWTFWRCSKCSVVYLFRFGINLEVKGHPDNAKINMVLVKHNVSPGNSLTCAMICLYRALA